MRNLFKDSQNITSHENCERVQDPYSMRCIPQVHGASRNAYYHLLELAQIEIEPLSKTINFKIGKVKSRTINKKRN